MGMSREDLGRMIDHNRQQTLLQKTRRDYLGGSAEIVERVTERVLIQNDPSYTTMCRLIKLVSGCETFSLISPIKSDNKHLSIDMEALVGDPTNTVVDQETVLLLNQYGFNDLYGPSRKYLQNLIDGKAELHRKIVENEDYRSSIPQLKHAQPDPSEIPHEQDDLGSGSRPSEAARENVEKPTATPKVYGPGGVSYDPPKADEPMEKPNIDLRPRSESVGASAKPKSRPPAPKSRPQSPASKAMPSSSSATTPRRPPSPPLPTRRQDEGARPSTYTAEENATNEPSQPSQIPVDPQTTNQGGWERDNWNQGRGRGRARGNRGWTRRTNRNWEYYSG